MEILCPLVCRALLVPSGVASVSTVADAAKARIDMSYARASAMYPGAIIKQALRREQGNRGAPCSFDVIGSTGTREIGVDAVTGKMLENAEESQDND